MSLAPLQRLEIPSRARLSSILRCARARRLASSQLVTSEGSLRPKAARHLDVERRQAVRIGVLSVGVRERAFFDQSRKTAVPFAARSSGS
jgi:hypothetical protein